MVNKRQGAAEEAVAGLTAAGLRYKMVLPALYFLDRGLRHPALVLNTKTKIWINNNRGKNDRDKL